MNYLLERSNTIYLKCGKDEYVKHIVDYSILAKKRDNSRKFGSLFSSGTPEDIDCLLKDDTRIGLITKYLKCLC